jgi:myosin heavy subunit
MYVLNISLITRDFVRYRLLATSETDVEENKQQTALSDRQVVDDMLLALDLDVTSYRLGLTQVKTAPV